MKNYKSLMQLLSIVLCCLAIGVGLLKLTHLNIILNLIIAVLCILTTKLVIGSYSNITFVFLAFHILYGLSGPVAAVYGDGIASIFNSNYNVDAFLIAFDLATIGLLIGITVCAKKFRSIELQKNEVKLNGSINYYLYMSFTMALFSTICEIINFIRVGGISTLLKGKAIYQAEIANLSLTMPSNIIACVAIALFGIYIIAYKYKIKKRYIFYFVMLLLPYLLVTIFLGQRGSLIAFVVIAILIYTYKKPIKVIKLKLVLLLCIIYFFMGFIYANRSIVSLITTDMKAFISEAFSSKRLITALNPATNEFGVGFGNFNEVYVSENYEFLWGKSYIEGLAVTVPSFLYLGEKPQQITYKFRDEFFYSESLRSAIAGTAFSSILEAYWNFGFLGVLVIYFIYGYIISKLDFYFKNKNEICIAIYLAISPFAVNFHRTAFGDIISLIIIKILILLLIYVFRTKKKN